MTPAPDCQTAALAYAGRGWPVLPVEPGGKRPIGKLVPHGVSDASTDPRTIRRWWAARPDASVGLAAGRVSGFDVLDVDGEEGEETLATLEREHGALPETVEALTGGGGRHLLFEHAEGLRNAVRFAPGLDVRTDGGYIVAPPSLHASGRAYCWEVTHEPTDAALASWPAWLSAMLASPKPKATAPGASSQGGTIRDGQRNAHLASLAGSMRKRGMTEGEILAGLREVNSKRCRPPLDDAEVVRIAQSISNYAPEASVDELLDSTGLKEGAQLDSGTALESVLAGLAEHVKEASPVRRAAIREEAIRRLKSGGVSSPAKAVDAALGPPPRREVDDERQGKALDFEQPDPWTAEVDGADLLGALVETLQKYVVMPKAGAEATALWVLHTWTWREAADFTPRLGITGPAKRCGKSRLLEVVSGIAYRPLMTANVSPAALFRSVERHAPTLLVDEGDTFLRESEDLRGLLNAGQRRGGAVIRTVGEDHEPRSFNVFAPVAIALIGDLPDTVRDRAILVPMRRKTKAEGVARLRLTPFHRECDPLRRMAARWAQDHAQMLREAEPALPEALDDRAQDGWEPLFAIADSAGGAWPERARAAALTLSESREAEDSSIGVRLLADMRTVFEDTGADRTPSAKLVEVLVAIGGPSLVGLAARAADHAAQGGRPAEALRDRVPVAADARREDAAGIPSRLMPGRVRPLPPRAEPQRRHRAGYSGRCRGSDPQQRA